MMSDHPDTKAESMQSTPEASIAICTFRRASLAETIKSLSALEAVDTALEIVVVDNDTTPSKREDITKLGEIVPWPLRYVHAPERNISIARNAALDSVRGKWLLFIDDDELASPAWAAELLSRRHDAEVVVGDVQAVYGAEAPSWMRTLDLHSTRLGDRTDTAYSGNALIDLGFVRKHGLRFREDLGRVGGEDTLFFRELTDAGGRILSNPDALVYEPVPSSRATATWLRRRQFRFGQTHAFMMRRHNPGRHRWLGLSAGMKTAISLLASLATALSRSTSRRWWLRAHLHAGAIREWASPTMGRDI